MKLGVTQRDFENGYYITDILEVMDSHNSIEAQRMLSDLNVGVASSRLQGDDFKRFADRLSKKAGYDDNDDSDMLDKSGLARLRGLL